MKRSIQSFQVLATKSGENVFPCILIPKNQTF